MKSWMRNAIACVLILTCSASAAPATVADVKREILAMPVGTNVELRLKNKVRLRGAKGTVSESALTLVGPQSGERQIDFADVASVKRFRAKSHTGRNVLIGIGAVVVVGVMFWVVLHTSWT